MVKKVINVGIEGNDATGDPIREAFKKTNENFTELYSVFGKGTGFPFTSLADYDPNRNGELVANSIFIVNDDGDTILAKTLEGDGIDVVLSDPNKITLKNLGSKLVFDSTPALGGNLNATQFAMGNLKDADEDDATALDVSIDTFVPTRGYVGSNYVNLGGSTMRGPLIVPADATGSQVPRRSEVIGKSGDTMTGALTLYGDPSSDLHAVTKRYVDNNSFSSQVNFFVTTNGRTAAQMIAAGVPISKIGRGGPYAFNSINEACQYAEDAVFASAIELGPYAEPITIASGSSFSLINDISDVTIGGVDLKRLQITNNGGSLPVDQGNPDNIDLLTGKLIIGYTSGAKAYLYTYRGVHSGYDEIDVQIISGTFSVGENLYFDQPVPTIEISIKVEAGVYYEHYPIRVSKNVSIIGDELRRTIVRPKTGISASPWVKIKFYRDTAIDGLTLITGSNYGYHYLTDSSDRDSDPKENRYIDAFMMNDATGLKDMSIQGHQGFAVILDPEGQILTKSPYIQNCSSLGASTNKKKFFGGMFIDGFAGRQTAIIDNVVSSTELEVSGLTFPKARTPTGDVSGYRLPPTPTSFWINGVRYKVSIIRNFDRNTGTGTLILQEDPLHPYSLGDGIDIVLENAGNRSALATHFTQINDLGYGVIVANNASTELVSVFTYYVHTAYYAYNGGNIRSVGGSNAYGFYGLKSEGSDPNEVPRPIVLADNLIQIARVYKRGSTFTGSGYNASGSSLITIYGFEYIPYSVTDLEINHPSSGRTIYSVNNVSMVSNSATISSISRSGTTVTVTTSSAHGFVTGDQAIISGTSTALDSETVTITVTDTTHFTYTSSGSGSINASTGTATSKTKVAKLNLGTGLNQNSTGLSGSVTLIDNIADGDYVILRSNQNFKFYGDFSKLSTRPSTALDFTGDGTSTTYRTIGLGTTYYSNSLLPGDTDYGNTVTLNDQPSLGITEIITVDSNFNYIFGTVTNTPATGTTTTIQISELIATDIARIVGMEFGWVDTNSNQKGFKRTVTLYEATSPGSYATITVDSALPANTLIPIGTQLSFGLKTAGSSTLSGNIAASGSITSITLASTASFSRNPSYIKINNEYFYYTGNNGTNTLSGISRAQLGSISAYHSNGATVQEISGLLTTAISTCRATSHDFLDIGTGGYNTANVPPNVLGDPVEAKVESSSAVDSNGTSNKAEVQEKSKGRVFFASTNQDGFFRVGRFFTVDQGTGTVSFNSSILLSNVSGLGFKRGISIAEFSNDTSMPDIGDAVPTNSAVRSYIDRRLGINLNSAPTASAIGPGFMPRNGSLAATANMNLGGYQIKNLSDPSVGDDAANKSYVDLFLKRNGGTRTGIASFTMDNAASGVIDMNSNKIINLATPTDANDAANKTYVDTAIASRDQLSELSDVRITSITDNELLMFGVPITAGSFVTGRTYNIVSVGTTNFVSIGATSGSVTFTDTGDLVTYTAHGLSNGNIVYFSAITTTTGISTNTLYYVISATTNTFQVASTSSGAALVLTTNGTGTAVKGVFTATGSGTGTGTASESKWSNTLISNASISSSAAIAQSKLNLNDATAASSAGAATKGISSFNNANFSISGGYVSLASNGVTLSNLAQIGTGYVLGNNTGATASPMTLTFPNVINGAIINTAITISNIIQGRTYTIATLGTTTQLQWNTLAGTTTNTYSVGSTLTVSVVPTLIIGEGTVTEISGVLFRSASSTFSTLINSSANIANSIVQRDSNGDFSARTLNVTSISAQGSISGSSIGATNGVSGATVTATSSVNAGTELQIYAKKIFDYNGAITQMYNQSGAKAVEVSGTSSAPAGKLYGPWTITTITTGAAATAGTITGTWSLTTGSTLQATYADLAEYYESDNGYDVGTVVMIGGDKEITISKGEGTTKVAGIVSKNPAFIMNEKCPGQKLAIALQGRVPCKVVGKVQKGDLLVTSMIPGVAMTSEDPKAGSIIGKSLGNYNSNRVGVVEVLVGKH